jgi:hypothetical protein
VPKCEVVGFTAQLLERHSHADSSNRATRTHSTDMLTNGTATRTQHSHADTAQPRSQHRHADTQHSHADTQHSHADSQQRHAHTRHSHADMQQSHADTQHSHADTAQTHRHKAYPDAMAFTSTQSVSTRTALQIAAGPDFDLRADLHTEIGGSISWETAQTCRHCLPTRCLERGYISMRFAGTTPGSSPTCTEYLPERNISVIPQAVYKRSYPRDRPWRPIR